MHRDNKGQAGWLAYCLKAHLFYPYDLFISDPISHLLTIQLQHSVLIVLIGAFNQNKVLSSRGLFQDCENFINLRFQLQQLRHTLKQENKISGAQGILMNKKTNGKILKIDRNRKLEILCRIDTYTAPTDLAFTSWPFSSYLRGRYFHSQMWFLNLRFKNHRIFFILQELKAEEVKMLMLSSVSGQNSDHRLVYCWCFVTRQKMVTDT